MVLVPRFGMVRLWLFSQTRLGPAHASRGRQVQAVGSLSRKGAAAKWRDGAKRRSAQAEGAEDEGAACARQGRSPSGGLVTSLGAERGRSIRSCFSGVGVAGRNGPQRWVSEDGRAGRSGEETPSSCLLEHVYTGTQTMSAPTRKRRLCSYDRSEVPPESYWLDDAQGAVYFCNARCLCVWSILLATKANLPEEHKTLDLDLVRRGGARLHFGHVRELARWALENALGRDEVNEP